MGGFEGLQVSLAVRRRNRAQAGTAERVERSIAIFAMNEALAI